MLICRQNREPLEVDPEEVTVKINQSCKGRFLGKEKVKMHGSKKYLLSLKPKPMNLNVDGK